MATHKLDARGLLCPMPVIRTQDRVSTLAPGDQLEISCSDPGALSDIPAWCRVNGHRLVSSEHGAGLVVITVEVGCSDDD